MSRTYQRHPFAEIFPFRDDASLIELSDDIKLHGQIEDIVLFEWKILDGTRRQAACVRAGVTPRYRQFGSRVGDKDDALEYAFAVNFYRRDLSESEKVLAAVGYANLKKGDNQHTQGMEHPANAGTSKPMSQKEAAEKFNVSAASVERAKSVMEKGTRELQEAMRDELVSISDAAAITNEKPDVQRQAVALVQAGEVNTLKEAVRNINGSPAEKAGNIVKDISALIERLSKLETEHTEARELGCEALRRVLEIVKKL